MLPYLDAGGFGRRTLMPPDDVATIAAIRPRFFETTAAQVQSHINARLRKRYGNSIPFGAMPAPLVPVGTLPPPLLLVGTPAVGSLEIVAQNFTAGALGASQFSWSLDGGLTFSALVTTAASVPLVGTGLALNMQPNAAVIPTWSTDNAYRAATPVPEKILWWMQTLITSVMYKARGRNTADPYQEDLERDVTLALAELSEAANEDTGLLDIPANEDAGSAISTGGPLAFSDASPYAWTDRQLEHGICQDYGTRRRF